ncbi:hypothetical protein F5884DRAFT_858575 [Xylogone sp. PMI_703]|nr:hypothetical protein F5884DRAFT_858575 [Xylogone sp. PMI_703]
MEAAIPYQLHPSSYQVRPNPCQAFSIEQSYLISLLQAENEKAMKVLQQISLLGKKLTHCHSSKMYKRVSQQVNWLYHRLEEITKQEKIILGSLQSLTPGNRLERNMVFQREEPIIRQNHTKSTAQATSNHGTTRQGELREGSYFPTNTAQNTYPLHLVTTQPDPQLPYEGYAWPTLPTPMNYWPSSPVATYKEQRKNEQVQRKYHDEQGLGLVNVQNQDTTAESPSTEATPSESENEMICDRQLPKLQVRRPSSMSEVELDYLTCKVGHMMFGVPPDRKEEKRRASVSCISDITSTEESEIESENEPSDASSLYPKYLGYYIKGKDDKNG